MNEKRAVLVALGYFKGQALTVLLDSRHEGVSLPETFMRKPEVNLTLGTHLAYPVRDLLATDSGFSATLRFSGVEHFCYVPWDAVTAIVNYPAQDYGRVWAPQSCAGRPGHAAAARAQGRAVVFEVGQVSSVLRRIRRGLVPGLCGVVRTPATIYGRDAQGNSVQETLVLS